MRVYETIYAGLIKSDYYFAIALLNRCLPFLTVIQWYEILISLSSLCQIYKLLVSCLGIQNRSRKVYCFFSFAKALHYSHR
jgi:hypothetical protein